MAVNIRGFPGSRPPPPLPQFAGPQGSRGPPPRPTSPATPPESVEEVRRLTRQVHSRIKLSQDNKDRTVFLSHYCQVHPVLQDGPMCGLVALCMASQLLGSKQVSPQSALHQAQALNFSHQGEMFSAANMGKLAFSLCSCTYTLNTNHEGNYTAVISALLAECPVLVPYDADGNNEPCLKRGTKAHWAVLTGLLCVTSRISQQCLDQFYTKDMELGNLHLVKRGVSLMSSVLDVIKDKSLSSVFVFAKHGKSSHTVLWSLDELLASNANLVEVGPKIVADMKNYMVPPEGIEKTLCNHLLILNNKK